MSFVLHILGYVVLCIVGIVLIIFSIHPIRFIYAICSVYISGVIRNYKALANVFNEECWGFDYHGSDITFYRRKVAARFLLKAGKRATKTIISCLLHPKHSPSDDLVEVMISINDFKALPTLQTLLVKGKFSYSTFNSTLKTYLDKNKEHLPKITGGPNTSGQVFTSGQRSLDDRSGVCPNCSKIVPLMKAIEFRAKWEQHYAFFYFCKTCNPSPHPKLNFENGKLRGTDGNEIVDQVPF